jgi:hypothetical protein
MRRVRGVVHGPDAGLTAPQKGGRPACEATLDRAATVRPSFFSYSPGCVEGAFSEVRGRATTHHRQCSARRAVAS